MAFGASLWPHFSCRGGAALCSYQGCGVQDFKAASTVPLPRFCFHQNVVISLVSIPPTSAEAPDPADRFRFRFPGPYSLNDQLSYLSNGYVLEKCPGNGVNIKHDALFDPHPLKIGFLGQFGPFPSPTAAGGGPRWPFLNSYSYFACLRPGIKHDYVP